MPPAVAAIVADAVASATSDIRLLARVMMDQGQDLAVVAHWFDLAGNGNLGPLDALLGPFARSRLEEALNMLARTDDAAALSSYSLEDWLGLDLESASVADIAASFGPLSRGQVAFLAERYADSVGPLDGAPLEARFAANRIMIERTVEDLENRATELRSQIDTIRADLTEAYRNIAPGTRAGAGPFMELGALMAQLEAVEARLASVREMATPGRNFLVFDPSGDGLAAEVLGDLDGAEHLAIMVPGMNTDMEDFAGFRADGVRLNDQANRFGTGDVATVVWLGYDTPTARDVAFADDAVRGAALLDRFVDGLRTQADPHVTAVGHSYGGVVTGTSLRAGVDVDDAVFIGAPGTGTGVTDASQLNTSADLWAGKNELPQEFVPSLPAHGEDPTEEGFGTRRFATNAPGSPEIEGHSSYYEANSESLYNIGAIVTGNDDLVSIY